MIRGPRSAGTSVTCDLKSQYTRFIKEKQYFGNLKPRSVKVVFNEIRKGQVFFGPGEPRSYHRGRR